MYAFFHPALAQTRVTLDLIIHTHIFAVYDPPVHTWNKSSSDFKHDMRQAGMKVDTWGYEIISSKHFDG